MVLLILILIAWDGLSFIIMNPPMLSHTHIYSSLRAASQWVVINGTSSRLVTTLRTKMTVATAGVGNYEWIPKDDCRCQTKAQQIASNCLSFDKPGTSRALPEGEEEVVEVRVVPTPLPNNPD